MKIIKNKSLKKINTFGIDISAKNLIIIKKEKDLFQLLNKTNKKIKILGGGSNILLTKKVKGILAKNEIKGIEIIAEDEETALVEIGAGENWHEFVLWAIQNNLGGVENLSLIPGTVGAAPIQNIGAYGVELKNVFEGLNFIDLETHEEIAFSKEACNFGYRNSIFKNELKNKFCITRVYLRLKKHPHTLNINYGIISKKIEEQKIKNPTIKNISDIIINIRQAKLPDPKKIGNSGSFFKNPEVSKKKWKKLKEKFPEIISYPLPNNQFKIPAAWLIDQCGFKGKKYGNTGCYKNQALVIVNYGNATGKEIKKFSKKVQKAVYKKFKIQIFPEVNIW